MTKNHGGSVSVKESGWMVEFILDFQVIRPDKLLKKNRRPLVRINLA